MVITKEEKRILDAGFLGAFGYEPERYFSAPGRTEIGGNHTDHQRGRVLAFVPQDLLPRFCKGIDEALGQGSCRVLSIRHEGGIELEVMK